MHLSMVAKGQIAYVSTSSLTDVYLTTRCSVCSFLITARPSLAFGVGPFSARSEHRLTHLQNTVELLSLYGVHAQSPLAHTALATLRWYAKTSCPSPPRYPGNVTRSRSRLLLPASERTLPCVPVPCVMQLSLGWIVLYGSLRSHTQAISVASASLVITILAAKKLGMLSKNLGSLW